MPEHCEPLLRSFMEAVGIGSWRGLARQAGVSPAAVGAVRRGEAFRLRVETAQKLAACLEVEPAAFLQTFAGVHLESRAERECGQWRSECLRLQKQLEAQQAVAEAHFRRETLQRLLPLLIQAPTLRRAAQGNPTLGAAGALRLLSPLEGLLADWGFEPIGAVWEPVAFDPELHLPDAADIAPGETVYVRFLGYRDQAEVLCRAKVSRTLPAGSGS
ncbi:helix-turn-helix domain-containing protein [Gloeobacter violaceus]|uniref:Gll3803 protein n=1 Tax=Gloeobacter violaceus (strain ATCC 29082 / PCC 7421) TaxID=251221 RepID=Q7NES5_GLOVI|nr:helix-turn-helix transcriptional regulator [Gloeobacter violaceus]BAC91744.1 gll3803 [Gloeobacter violaceus PCC 7421]